MFRVALSDGVLLIVFLVFTGQPSGQLLGEELWSSEQPEVQSLKKQPSPVKFVDYMERGKWTTWADKRFSLRVPANWTVTVNRKKTKGNVWYYMLGNDRGKDVFEIHVVEGGPEWIVCFCAPKSHYEFTENVPYKIWALTQEIGDSSTRRIKVSNKELRLDIHAVIPPVNRDQIRYIAESARVKR